MLMIHGVARGLGIVLIVMNDVLLVKAMATISNSDFYQIDCAARKPAINQRHGHQLAEFTAISSNSRNLFKSHHAQTKPV